MIFRMVWRFLIDPNTPQPLKSGDHKIEVKISISGENVWDFANFPFNSGLLHNTLTNHTDLTG